MPPLPPPKKKRWFTGRFIFNIYFSGYATDPSEFDDDLDQDDDYSEDEPTTTVGYNEGWADNELVNFN